MKEVPMQKWQRPAEPEHPMSLEGAFVPGDVQLMMTCFFEEFLRSGCSRAELAEMMISPNYQALHACYCVLGPERSAALLEETAARIGIGQIRITEVPVPPCPLESFVRKHRPDQDLSKENQHA